MEYKYLAQCEQNMVQYEPTGAQHCTIADIEQYAREIVRDCTASLQSADVNVVCSRGRGSGGKLSAPIHIFTRSSLRRVAPQSLDQKHNS